MGWCWKAEQNNGELWADAAELGTRQMFISWQLNAYSATKGNNNPGRDPNMCACFIPFPYFLSASGSRLPLPVCLFIHEWKSGAKVVKSYNFTTRRQPALGATATATDPSTPHRAARASDAFLLKKARTLRESFMNMKLNRVQSHFHYFIIQQTKLTAHTVKKSKRARRGENASIKSWLGL